MQQVAQPKGSSCTAEENSEYDKKKQNHTNNKLSRNVYGLSCSFNLNKLKDNFTQIVAAGNEIL